MNVTVIGCGYVGLTTAVILANSGYQVAAIEKHPERLATIQSGRSFFYEAGIDTLLSKALKDGSLSVSGEYGEDVRTSDMVFSCVGTPDNPDGSTNLDYVLGTAGDVAKLLKPGAIFVQKSTVPVGTGQKVMEILAQNGGGAAYVSNPEFLREGTALSDSLWFDRAVSGSSDAAAAQAVLGIYKTIEEQADSLGLAAGLTRPVQTPEPAYMATSLASAELIKVTANAFLALKISFANSIAKLADQAGADIVEVMDGVGADRRIGRAFLNAGRGYGGGCFPKDVSGLIHSAGDYRVDMEIMKSVVTLNDSMPDYVIGKAEQAMGGSLAGKTVAVLGLAFKANTSDTRRSPAIDIANKLSALGAAVRAYDPQAMAEARSELAETIILCDDAETALTGSDCVFVATEWPEFRELDWQNVDTKLVVDCMNCLDSSKLKVGTTYIGVGR